jgi:hypothetical protein
MLSSKMIRLFVIGMTFYTLTLSVSVFVFAGNPMTMETNIERHGMDYKNFWLDSPDPNLCRDACADDPNCKAYTYVKPIGNKKARCWLKNAVPPPKTNPFCVSGVKTAQANAFKPTQGGGSGVTKPDPPQLKCGHCEMLRDDRCVPCREAGLECSPDGVCVEFKSPIYGDFRWEKGVDRPGMDYENFLLDSADPNDCAKACEEDPNCAAFTYANPGVTGPKAHCFLKSGVPPAKQSEFYVSGVKAGLDRRCRKYAERTMQQHKLAQEMGCELWEADDKWNAGYDHYGQCASANWDQSTVNKELDLREKILADCRSGGGEAKPLLYGDFRWEKGLDRPGMDYENFLLDSADPNDCAKACEEDPNCAAFTYANPGVTGPKAHCFLKSGVPPAKRSPRCISGVKE